MSTDSRKRANPEAEAEQAAVNQLLTLQDACALFDGGRDHQFVGMAVSLRALCHDGSSGSLLNSVREKGRAFPSSVRRDFAGLDNAASDHFAIAQGPGGARAVPRLELGPADMKAKKFKHWWRETVVTDGRKRGLTRGGIVLAVANSEGGAHFTLDVDELYDDLARRNGLGLFAMERGSWRTFGLAPVQATVRQIAHEFLLGMEGWIKTRRPDWSYTPVVPEISGLALAPGIRLGFLPAPAGHEAPSA